MTSSSLKPVSTFTVFWLSDPNYTNFKWTRCSVHLSEYIVPWWWWWWCTETVSGLSVYSKMESNFHTKFSHQFIFIQTHEINIQDLYEFFFECYILYEFLCRIDYLRTVTEFSLWRINSNRIHGVHWSNGQYLNFRSRKKSLLIHTTSALKVTYNLRF